MDEQLEAICERALAQSGVVFLLGGIDTGKTTFGLELVRRAHAAGVPAAFVDGDVGQSTIGPPTTVGLAGSGALVGGSDLVRSPDAMAFVGAISPRGHLLPLVTGTARLTARARAQGSRLVVVDTTGFVSGIYGQTLKFFKMEMVAPDLIVAFERGGDLEPLVGIAQRFLPAEIAEVQVSDDVAPRSVEDRAALREARFGAYFAGDLSRWKVKPTVFMPTLPPEFDLGLLDGLVVGMDDGRGECVGIGLLEYDEAGDFLRMVSPVDQGVRGLRLGSIRMDTDGRSKGPVDLRHLFRTE